MAEEYTLSVGVDADMTKFRQTLRAELEAAKQQGATIPVGAQGGIGGGGGANIVPPGAATATIHPGAAPTAVAVAQQGAAAIATAAARAGLPVPAAVAAQAAAAGVTPYELADAGPYSLAPAGTRRGSSIMDLSTPARPDDLFPPEEPTGPGAETTDAAAGRGGRFGRRVFGAVAIAHAVGRIVGANTQYNEALSLSRGDPRALAMADVQNYHALGSIVPFVGDLAMGMREAATGDEAYIRRTLQDAGDEDAYTNRLRERGDLAQQFRQRGELAGLRGAAAQRAGAEFEYQGSMLEIARKQAVDSEALHDRFTPQRNDIERQYQRMLPPPEGANSVRGRQMTAEADAYRASKLGAIQQAEDDAVAKLKDQYGPMRSAAVAVRQRAFEDIQTGVSADDLLVRANTTAAMYSAANQPLAARTARRFGQYQAAYLKAPPEQRAGITAEYQADIADTLAESGRDFSRQMLAVSTAQDITHALLLRDPLGARIADVEGERKLALQADQKLPEQQRQQAIDAHNDLFNARRDLIIRDWDDARGLRLQQVTDRTEHFNLLAEGKTYTAQARDIEDSTKEDVASMRQSGRFSAEEIKKRVELGVAQEKALQFQLGQAIGAQNDSAVAPMSMGGGVARSRSEETMQQGFQNVVQAIKDLQTLLSGGDGN